jgi:hypothetical protein
MSGRLNDLLDRSLFPAELRDIEPDGTALVGAEVTGIRLDAARQAVRSAGGTLWADGEGRILYRTRHFTLPDDPSPAMRIGTTAADDAAPSGMVLGESGTQVQNFIFRATLDKVHEVTVADANSRSRYGLAASMQNDRLNVDRASLVDIAQRELDHGAWPLPRVDPIEVIVHDEGSALVTHLGIGSLVHLTYSGADPWDRLQIVGGIAHRVTPDEWSTVLRCYDPLTLLVSDVSQWSLSRWGVGTWGGDPDRPPPEWSPMVLPWTAFYWVDGEVFREDHGPPQGIPRPVFAWRSEKGDLDQVGWVIGWRPPQPQSQWGMPPAPEGVDLNTGQLGTGPQAPRALPVTLVWCGYLLNPGAQRIVAAKPVDDPVNVPCLQVLANGTFRAATGSGVADSRVAPLRLVPFLVLAEFHPFAASIEVNGVSDIGGPVTGSPTATGFTLSGAPSSPTMNPTDARTWAAGLLPRLLSGDEKKSLRAWAGRYGVITIEQEGASNG